MTDIPQFSLSGWIRAAMADSAEPDPHVLARRLLDELPESAVRNLALVGLVHRVSQEMAAARQINVKAPTVEMAVPKESPKVLTRGRSKWHVHVSVHVPHAGHKLLMNCNVADLRALAESHREISERNLSRARDYEELAEELAASGASTLGEMWGCAAVEVAA